MHKDFDLNIKDISKIEGHAEVDVKVISGEVKYAKLKISENKRFYVQAIRDTHYMTAAGRASRICGTCSPAHLICCAESIEKALGITLSEQSIVLRQLILAAENIRDHAMHLYFFVLPDLLKRESVFDFNEKEHKWVHDALEIKSAGNLLGNTIGGRSVHPTYPVVGGFTNFPDKKKIKETLKKLKSSRDKVLDFIDFLKTCPYTFKRKTNYVGLVTDEFTLLEGEIHSTSGEVIQEKDYWHHLMKIIIPYSTAVGFEFEGKEFMVGALSRINLSKDNLHKSTKRDCKDALKMFPSDCIFHNNLAQAIEIVHGMDWSIDKLEGTDFKKEPIAKPTREKGRGVGVLEAPRGTLYYSVDIDKKGIINDTNIIIPTSQNAINIERDIKLLVQQIVDKPKKFIQFEIEKLIRAYDPCMSCATHFLKLNWR